MDSIELQAARESSAGKRVSPAQLVATALGALTVDRVHESLRDAVEGAMRVAPDERWRRSFLDEAAEGTARILRAALADARTGEAWTVADALVDELDRATDVLYAAAAALVRPGSDEPA
jgi:predicted alpha/beta hydrolase family esterase